MLVLSRKIGRRLMIDEDVTITILEVRGNAVLLGIEAPEDVRVDREEVRERMQAAEKRGAA